MSEYDRKPALLADCRHRDQCPLIVTRDTVTRDHVPHQHLRVGDHGAVPARHAAAGPRRQHHHARHRRGA